MSSWRPSVVDVLLPDAVALLSDRVAWLTEQVAALALQVVVLERRARPRDAHEVALLGAIALTLDDLHDQTFTAAALISASRHEAALQRALEDADIDSAIGLGKLLARIAGSPVGGYVVERVGPSRDGMRWRLRRCEGDPHVAGLGQD